MLGEFDLVIVDECDTGTTKKFIEALCNCNATYVYGFTGTPYRKDLDNDDMQKIYGKQILVTGGKDYAFKPVIHMLSYKSPEYLYENFAELKTMMVEDEDRLKEQVKVIKQLKSQRKCILILTERVEEAKQYAEAFPDAILITGETDSKDDEELLKQVYEGTGHIIVGTVGKMARGVDIPPIDTICMFCALMFQ